MNPVAYICIGLSLLLVVLTVVTYRKIKQRRLVGTALYGLQTFLVLALLAGGLLILSNLNTYQRLSFEENIVEVVIERITTQKFELQLVYAEAAIRSDVKQIYVISGDEWQLDTRIIKWKGWANLFGMDSYYRLDRLSGRYAKIDQANTMSQTAYQLFDAETGLSIWDLKRLLKSKLPFLDAYYGQSIFLPMKHGARFKVTISQSGLLVRPENEIARLSLEGW
jgi:hypothetical protein